MQHTYICMVKKKCSKRLKDFIETYRLTKTLSSRAVTIWENEDFKLSEDKKIIRITVYDETNIDLINQIKDFLTKINRR